MLAFASQYVFCEQLIRGIEWAGIAWCVVKDVHDQHNDHEGWVDILLPFWVVRCQSESLGNLFQLRALSVLAGILIRGFVIYFLMRGPLSWACNKKPSNVC